MPLPEPEPKDEGDLPSDDELSAMFGDDDDEESVGSASFSPDSNDDFTELDEDALENLPDPDPIESFSPDSDDEFEDYEDMDPDDIPDPDPIPTVFEVDAGGDEKRSLKGLIIGGVAAVLVLGILAGTIFMRETLVGMWAGSNDIFTMIGLRVPQPGDGLDLSLKNPVRATKDGKDSITFDIIVENTTEEAQQIPVVISTLIDANGTVVQETQTSPPKPTVAAGKILRFKAVFINAPATARQSLARWGEYKMAGKGAMKKDEK